MNIYTREIMSRFYLTAEDALEVQKVMDENFSVDYSEATQRMLNFAYDAAYAAWREAKATV